VTVYPKYVPITPKQEFAFTIQRFEFPKWRVKSSVGNRLFRRATAAAWLERCWRARGLDVEVFMEDSDVTRVAHVLRTPRDLGRWLFGNQWRAA